MVEAVQKPTISSQSTRAKLAENYNNAKSGKSVIVCTTEGEVDGMNKFLSTHDSTRPKTGSKTSIFSQKMKANSSPIGPKLVQAKNPLIRNDSSSSLLDEDQSSQKIQNPRIKRNRSQDLSESAKFTMISPIFFV